MSESRDFQKIKARLKNLCERSVSLVPEDKRADWLIYLNSHFNHYASFLSHIPTPESCGPLLEIGSFPCRLTILLSETGYKITGVDIDPGRLSQLWNAHSIQVKKVNIETERLAFEDGKFSVVLFTEFLEHLFVHPVFVLREIARVTAAGGKIILSVPNITPRHRLRFFLGLDYQGYLIKAFQKYERIGHVGHVRLYSASEIERLLTFVGYNHLKFIREGRIKGRLFWRLFSLWCRFFRGKLYVEAMKTC